ncbi:putative xanthine dehydrogenase subunit A [Croceivirga lutea]|uniref:XdhC family protein n=1 Tax=Croceivirga lutea TaxID=1775167 RepID=UPI001639FD9C|nr:XdhC/CoxI family protein [Croceivirga lutea]GGG45263.1 putative xanthine dehydrogenase subunit A [Croceivirga lutea]
MTHELKKIITGYEQAAQSGIKTVLATVVALDGSSYRRPGVQMLVLENGTMVGAVSGGCVEKEVFRQAETVFKTTNPKMITYDGRYRLGCEGILYILLEPLQLESKVIKALKTAFQKRQSFQMASYYEQAEGESVHFGSILTIDGQTYPVNTFFQLDTKKPVFEQEFSPCYSLIIIGAEHDAVQLAAMASQTGWDVTVVVNPREEKTLSYFIGASKLVASDGDGLDLPIDAQTAVVVMTHSYAKDLKYLLGLKKYQPGYLGLLGPARRREQLFNELLALDSDIAYEFIENINGPAGLDIGAETSQEIAIAILAEIIALRNQKTVNSLKNKEGKIHA